VDLLDVIVIAVAIGAAIGGYRLGFLGRFTSWAGLAGGFVAAILLLPSVMVDLASSRPGVQLAVAILLLVGGAMVGQAIGLLIGIRLHGALPPGAARQIDRTVGAGLGVAGVITVLWLLLPSVAAVPGWPAQAAANSGISRWVSVHLPAPPNALQILRRIIQQNAPQVFAVLHPGGSAGPTPTASPLSRAVTLSVVNSTAKVEGNACGLVFEGSGFAVGPDLVATNAHVVAGEHPGHTTVLLPSGDRLAATVVMFDPRRDLALLHVGSLGENPLHWRVAPTGTTGAVFGHPNGRDPVFVAPARIAVEESAVGPDIYDNANTRRDILILAAALAHGDSGGPLVDVNGTVMGVAFAIDPNHPGTSYALNTTELQAALSEPRNPSGVSTGPCLQG
jgi:S1-C subfamily serine protease